MGETDTISRQLAIEALDELFKKVVHPSNMSAYEYDSAYAQGEIDTYVTAIDTLKTLASVKPEPKWIPCSERLPEEDHWLGGSGRQFSDEVLVSVVNYDDEDTWVYISQTIDGKWALELPRHCEITAWMPLPEPYRGGEK